MNETTLAQIVSKEEILSTQKLILIQAIAGSLFTVFLILHLLNTLIAALGVDQYNRFQSAAQALYQHPVFELLFIAAPLLTHAIIGVTLLLRKRKKRLNLSNKQRLNSWAGLFLLVVVFGHVVATRGVALFNEIETGFATVSFSLWWMPAYFIPYYFLLFMAGLFHGYNGISLLANRVSKTAKNSLTTARPFVMSIAALVLVVALGRFMGLLGDIPDPRDSDYARVYAGMLNIDLQH